MTETSGEVEVWRGGVPPWECDEMGHLNVRFYVARALEGLAGLTAELGMAGAYGPSAASTVAVREHHIRFLSEAQVGTPLAMTAGVLAMGDHEARVLLVLRHGRTGQPCASFLTRIAHISVREARPFDWSARTRAAAQALMTKVPDFARPRGLPEGPVQVEAGRSRAEALGVPVIGRGVVRPDECDVFGRMRGDAVMGRCAEAATHFFDSFVSAGPDGRIGRALLEARLIYLRAATAGARLELRSAVAGLDAKVERFAHWLINPEDGQPWASAMVLGGAFDLDARKLTSLPKAERSTLEAKLIEGMGF